MSSKIDKKLLWNPRKQNSFIVGGGSQLRLFEWAPDVPEFRLVTSLADLQFMKVSVLPILSHFCSLITVWQCFAWSPNPSLDDLVAVGTSSGKLDLWLLGSNRFARDNIVSASPAVTLPVRSTRSCNALAFCPENPNVLAAGFDKVRGDSSLVVWDITGATGILSATTSRVLSHSTLTIKADRNNPHGYAPAEVVTSVAFLPSSPNSIAAGVSNLWLRMFDLRKEGTHVAQASAKVHGIVTDPFNTHRIATYGEGAVYVWDSRRITAPLLTFTLKDAAADGARPFPNNTFSCVEFSSVRRGVLATLTKDEDHVRFWDIQNTPNFESRPTSESSRPRDGSKDSGRSSNKLSRLSWTVPSAAAILPSSWTGATDQPRSPGEISSGHSNVVLSDTRKSVFILLLDFPERASEYTL